jgi:Fanconi anemia group M protein
MGNMAVTHSLLKEGAIESRLYQETVLGTAAKKNTLVVLPTGLGKTFVAALLAAKRLDAYPDSRVLFVAPTKPLVEQHRNTWKDTFTLEGSDFQVFTGMVPAKKRAGLYKEKRFIFATPQVIQNDLLANRISLADFSLLVIDEAHRTSGEYPYSYIAKRYMNSASNPRILALTASPGSNRAHVDAVCKELFIEAIEARDRDDADVRPYVQTRHFEWVSIRLPPDFIRMRRLFEKVLKQDLEFLKRGGVVKSSAVNHLRKKMLLDLQGELAARASEDPAYYPYLSSIAAAFKIYHCIELLETQGIYPLYEYLKKLRSDSSKAAKRLMNDYNFKTAVMLAESLYNSKEDHPKLEKLLSMVRGGETVIVFAQYRASVKLILNRLEEKGISATELIGQAGKGISQKEQIKRLDDFRQGKYQVLVATSVGEEGLDIPSVDRVIFYEPVPSAIRSIQRGGRTARVRPGKVSVLVAEGTRDEAYYWSSQHRERSMRGVLKGAEVVAKAQRTLDKYSEEPGVVVFADVRESGSGILKDLSGLGVEVRTKQLDVADFQLSSRVGVERKSAADFLQSLIDGRLLSQAKQLASAFDRPMLVIEGGSLYGLRKIHPNAIRGALAAITIDFGIPVLYTDDRKDTAALLAVIAKREQLDLQKEPQLRSGRKPFGTVEMQQFIVESLPRIGPGLAKRLLEQFKTVEKVMTAPEAKLQKVEKIGEKKAKEIRRVLTEFYNG